MRRAVFSATTQVTSTSILSIPCGLCVPIFFPSSFLYLSLFHPTLPTLPRLPDLPRVRSLTACPHTLLPPYLLLLLPTHYTNKQPNLVAFCPSRRKWWNFTNYSRLSSSSSSSSVLPQHLPSLPSLPLLFPSTTSLHLFQPSLQVS